MFWKIWLLEEIFISTRDDRDVVKLVLIKKNGIKNVFMNVKGKKM